MNAVENPRITQRAADAGHMPDRRKAAGDGDLMSLLGTISIRVINLVVAGAVIPFA
jgi:hypothetical protein